MKNILVIVACVLFLGVPLRADTFSGTVEVSQPDASTWAYSVLNDENASSPNFVTSFALTVDAPFAVVGTPDGWAFQTDNSTFVYWFNTDPALPYPHDIAPGASLSGFILSAPGAVSASEAFSLAAWNHTLDQPGPTVDGMVLAPSALPIQSSPEPATVVTLGFSALFLIARSLRRVRCGV
jgi:hypothetical protein